MASLAQKDVTQATIVRKLASYARQNQTKKALWELENICRTLYILDFIDDVHLRQSVQKALNRGEAYHRFRRAVAFVNGGKFRVKTEAEQQIWNECARLITNAVIYYNMALLSKVYEQKSAANDQQAMAIIQGISPVAWQHVNLFCTFEFSPAGRAPADSLQPGQLPVHEREPRPHLDTARRKRAPDRPLRCELLAGSPTRGRRSRPPPPIHSVQDRPAGRDVPIGRDRRQAPRLRRIVLV